MQFDGETDKQTAALQCESAGKSVNRGSVLPGGWGGWGVRGLEMGEGRRQVGVGVGSVGEGFLGDMHLSRTGEC